MKAFLKKIQHIVLYWILSPQLCSYVLYYILNETGFTEPHELFLLCRWAGLTVQERTGPDPWDRSAWWELWTRKLETISQSSLTCWRSHLFSRSEEDLLLFWCLVFCPFWRGGSMVVHLRKEPLNKLNMVCTTIHSNPTSAQANVHLFLNKCKQTKRVCYFCHHLVASSSISSSYLQIIPTVQQYCFYVLIFLV